MKKWLIAGLVLAVIAGAVVFYLRETTTDNVVLADPDCPSNAPIMAMNLYGDLRQDDVAVVHRDLTVERLTEDHASWGGTLSPDGTKIVYTNGSEGFWEECCGFSEHRLYIMNSDGTDQRRFIAGNHQDSSATWSPDGSTIAFVRDQRHLMLVPASGEDPRVLYEAEVEVHSPEWSPDGDKIALMVDGDLIIVSVDTGEAEVLTEELEGGSLAWSPDGETIALAGGSIFTVTMEEPNPRLFSEDGHTPVWSPDGNHLAYYFDDEANERYEIVTQPATGGEETSLPLKRKDIYSFVVDLDWLDCPASDA